MQISDNEIYLLIKYIISFLWRVTKPLSYKQDTRCLKVNYIVSLSLRGSVLKNCLPVLYFGASYFLVIFFNSIVQSDILAVERVSTHEYQEQRVLFSCCFAVAYLTRIFLAFEPTMQHLCLMLYILTKFHLVYSVNGLALERVFAIDCVLC